MGWVYVKKTTQYNVMLNNINSLLLWVIVFEEWKHNSSLNEAKTSNLWYDTKCHVKEKAKGHLLFHIFNFMTPYACNRFLNNCVCVCVGDYIIYASSCTDDVEKYIDLLWGILNLHQNSFTLCFYVASNNKQKPESIDLMALSVSPVLFYSDSSLASLSSFCNYCVILPHALERPTTARRDTKRFHTHTHAFTHTRPLRAGTRDRQLVFSVDCRSSIRLYSAPGINQNTGNGTKILGGAVLMNSLNTLSDCVVVWTRCELLRLQGIRLFSHKMVRCQSKPAIQRWILGLRLWLHCSQNQRAETCSLGAGWKHKGRGTGAFIAIS